METRYEVALLQRVIARFAIPIHSDTAVSLRVVHDFEFVKDFGGRALYVIVCICPNKNRDKPLRQGIKTTPHCIKHPLKIGVRLNMLGSSQG